MAKMRRNPGILAFAGLVLFMFIFSIYSVQASTPGDITSCDTLDTSGVYTFTSTSWSASGTCFFITADNVVLDGRGCTLTGNGSGTGVSVTGAIKNLVIENFAGITNFSEAILFSSGVTNSSIINNTLTDNTGGFGAIRLTEDSDNNRIISNMIADNAADGIYIGGANNVNISHNLISGHTYYKGIDIVGSKNGGAIALNETIINNSVTDNYIGIYLTESQNNTLTNNTADSNTEYGIWLDTNCTNNTLTNNSANDNTESGILIEDSTTIKLLNNTATSNGNHGIYLVSSSNITLIHNMLTDNSLSGIILVESQNNTLTNNTANSNSNGIDLYDNSNFNVLVSNSAGSNDWDGISLDGSSNNNLTLNALDSNDFAGIYLLDLSNNNTLANNSATNNDDHGILVSGGSSNNNLTFNWLDSNRYTGIWLYESENNTLASNLVTDNTFFGIEIQSSPGSILTTNNMSGNGGNFYVWGATNLDYNNTIEADNIVDYGYILYYNYSINHFVYDVIGAPNAGAIICADCYNITIKDANLSHAAMGVSLFNVTKSLVQNITANYNYWGIHLALSSGNILINNTANGNVYLGIYLYYGSNNTLANNTAGDNSGTGIDLQSSSSNILRGNNMSGNLINFYIDGESNAELNQSIDASNIVDYVNKIYYNYSIANYRFNATNAPSAGAVGCIACDSVIIEDLNLSSWNGAGVFFFNTSNSFIDNITSNNNDYGIAFGFSSNNNITDSSIDNSYSDAIYIVRQSLNNVFKDITATNSNDFDIEIADDGNDGTYLIDCDFANYYIESPGSLIYFQDSDYGEIKFLNPIDGTGIDLSTNVVIEGDYAYVNSTNTGLNESANITLYDVTTDEIGYKILRNGAECPSTICTAITSLEGGDVSFNVTHWSSYAIGWDSELEEEEATTGGGGGGISIIYVTDAQLSEGISELVSGGNKIVIELAKSGGAGGGVGQAIENHTITINRVYSNKVALTIQSNPIKLNVSVGEEKKLSLTSSGYYDLYLKLNSITNGKADLTIKSIHEAIGAEVSAGEGAAQAGAKEVSGGGVGSWIYYLIGGIIVIVIIIFLVLKLKKKEYQF